MLPLPHDLIDVNAAARMLGVHVTSVYRWIYRGQLPAWKVGGRWKLSKRDVEAFPRRSGPAAAAPAIPSHAEAVSRLRQRGYYAN